MKKIAFYCISILLFYQNQALGQGWVGNETGKVLYPVNSLLKKGNIKVGIGTKRPSTSLHLQGTSTMFRLSDGTEGENFILMSDALGNATWSDPNLIFSGTDHDWYRTDGLTPPTSIGQNIFTEGKVGIGYNAGATSADLSVLTDIFSKRRTNGFHRLQFGLSKQSDRQDVRFGITVANAGNGISNRALLGFSVEHTGDVNQANYSTTSFLTPSGIEFMHDRIRFISGAPSLGNGTTFNPTETLTILNDGMVGIGTNAPISPLHVDGEVYVQTLRIGKHPYSSKVYGYFGNVDGKGAGDGTLYFAPRNLNINNGSYLSLGQRSSETGRGNVEIVAGYYAPTGMYGRISLRTGSAAASALTIDENGDVGIGTPLTSNPENYKLAIQGKVGIYDDLVIENTSATWADYVFEKNYDLLSLDHVADYIESNKHLPHVPSAKDVKENGVNVVEMDAILLRKIEELTLYMIDMKDKNDQLVKRVKVLEHQLDQVKN